MISKVWVFSHWTANSHSLMTGFLWNKNFKCTIISNDTNGRIIIMEAHIDDEIFALIDLYNSNSEVEQTKTLYKLDQILGKFSLDSYQKVIFTGDFAMFFNTNLEAPGGNPTLKTLKHWNVLPPFGNDHSLILFSYDQSSQTTLGINFWKLNNTLVQDKTYILNMKEHIKHVKTSLDSNLENYEDCKQEF